MTHWHCIVVPVFAYGGRENNVVHQQSSKRFSVWKSGDTHMNCLAENCESQCSEGVILLNVSVLKLFNVFSS